LLDVYHSLGALPVDVIRYDADFAVGGSYKYLRGGPGACFLYLHPRHLDGSLRTLDIGWFAKREPFAYERPDPPELAAGGDAFLESTPAVLAWYQARAGQRLALALDVSRVRAYSLSQQRRLVSLLADEGSAATGGTDDHGAFVVVTHERAAAWREALAERGIVTDARGIRARRDRALTKASKPAFAAVSRLRSGIRVIGLRRDRAQVFVDRAQILVGLLAELGPRHHLQQHAGRVERIVSGTQRRDELREREARGTAERVGRDVRRGERTELPAAGQELVGVDLFGLAEERTAAGRVGRVRVTVVARPRVDDV